MKIVLEFLAFLSFHLILSTAIARADQVEVTKAQPLNTEYRLSQSGSASFFLDNRIGDIEVFEASGDSISLDGTYDGSTPVKVELGEVEPGKFNLVVVYPEGLNSNSISISASGPFSISINGSSNPPLHLRVGIPKSLLLNLELKSDSGNLSIKGAFENEFAPKRLVRLKSSSGDVLLDCGSACGLGELIVDGDSGGIDLRQIQANTASITNDSGEIVCQGICTLGKLTVEGSSGRIDLRQIQAKSASITNESAKIVCLGICVDGDLAVENSFGKIRLEGIVASSGTVSVTSQTGDITLIDLKKDKSGPSITDQNQSAQGTNGHLRLTNETGNVTVVCSETCIFNTMTVKSETGTVKLANIHTRSATIDTETGKIDLDAIDGRLKVEASFASVESKGGEGDMDVTSETGKVTISDRKQGTVTVRTETGKITLNNPDPSVTEDAQSELGKVVGLKAKGAPASCEDRLKSPKK